MRIRTVLELLLMAGVPAAGSACTALAPSAPELPSGAIEIAMPTVYREWFLKTEACSGRTGNLDTVQFYVVPGVDTFLTEDGAKVGKWVSTGRSHRVIIAGNYQNHEMVVRHELLHTLLRQSGHPEEFFVNRCGLTWETWNSGD